MNDMIKKIILSVYGVTKHYTYFQLNTKNGILLVITRLISIVLTVFFLIILCSIFCPFILWHTCLKIFLKITYGKLYGGLLNGSDTVFEIRKRKTIINVVLIFSCTDNSFALIEKLRQCALLLYQSNFKLRSKIRCVFGYLYYLKDQVIFDQVVEVIRYNNDEFMTRDHLFDYLKTHCDTITGDFMWQVKLFSQPICWNTSKNNEQIAMVMTFRHAIGDYPSIIGFIKKYFQLQDAVARSTKQLVSNNQEINFLEELNRAHIVRNPFTLPDKKNSINICYNLDWHIATFIEEQTKYVTVVKTIKQKLNTTFVGILTSAISTSICQYAKKKNIDVNNIAMTIISRPMKEDIPKIVNATFDFEKLENNFGPFLIDVPYNERTSMKHSIIDMQRYNQTLSNAVDPFILYVFNRYCTTYLPVGFTNLLSKIFMDDVVGLISNVGGLPKSVCCGSAIDDIFFFSSRFLKIGFSFFIHTYDDRFQVVAISRNGIVNNKEELQEIVTNAFKNIDKAAEEVNLNH